jgi:hypothetical protein
MTGKIMHNEKVYRAFVILALTIVLINLFSIRVYATDTWWNTSWGNRLQVNLTSVADTKTNFPIKIQITSTMTTGTNFSYTNVTDNRWADSSGNALIFWHQKNDSITSESYDYVVVNLTSGSNLTIYLYYGNPTAVSASSFTNTFTNSANLKTWFDFTNDMTNYGTLSLNGTINGAPVRYKNKAGWINNSYYFNGTLQSINSSDSSDYDNQTHTISFWANSTTDARQAPVSKWWDGSKREFFFSFKDNAAGGSGTNQIAYYVGFATTFKAVNCTVPAGTLSDGTYHFYTASYNSGVGTLFLDGVQRCNKTITYTMLSNTAQFVIGQNAYSGGTDLPFKGTVYDVRFYNKALTDAEVGALYISAFPILISGQEEYNTTAPPADTCTYSGTGNYAVTCSDNCKWASNVNLATKNVTITGSGFCQGLKYLKNATRITISGGCRVRA